MKNLIIQTMFGEAIESKLSKRLTLWDLQSVNVEIGLFVLFSRQHCRLPIHEYREQADSNAFYFFLSWRNNVNWEKNSRAEQRTVYENVDISLL